MNINLNLKTKMAGFYEVRLRTPDGRLVPFKGYEKPIKNIITNNGLDSVFTRTYLASMAYLVIGTGSTAAAVTDTGLQTYYATSQLMSASENGRTSNFAGRYRDDFRTFYWTNSTGRSKTIYELGMAWLGTSNPAVFSRIVVSAGLTIPTGYDLVVKYTLRKYVPIWRQPQSVSVTYYNGTENVTQAGTLMYACAANGSGDNELTGMSYPNSDGISYDDMSTTSLLEPSRVDYAPAYAFEDKAGFCTNTTQFSGLLTPTGTLPNDPSVTTSGSMSLSTYIAGSFTRTKSFQLNPASYPSTAFHSLVIGNDSFIHGPMLIWDASASFTKFATHSWTVGITYTVERA